MRRSAIAPMLGLLAVAALASLLGGCAVAARSPHAAAISTAPRANSALFLADRLAAGALYDDAPESARRDHDLSLAFAEPITAGDSWPQPAPPTLQRRRSVSLQTRSFSDTVVFFLPERPHRSHWRHAR